MKTDTYEKTLQKNTNPDGVKFIGRLLEKGIPLNVIYTNDWDNTTKCRVILEVPYGTIGGGKHIVRERFQDRDVEQVFNKWQQLSKKWEGQ